MGAYGPIIPGTDLESFAVQALIEKQREEIARTNLLVSASIANDGDTRELNKALKQYLNLADPVSKIARKKKDLQMRKLLKEEVDKWAFAIEPISDYGKHSVSLREKPRLSRRHRARKAYAPGDE